MKNRKFTFLVVASVLAGGCSKWSESVAIEPGIAVGPVHSGMTIEQVISQLGQPDNTNHSHLSYSHLGLTIVPGRSDAVERVIIGYHFAGRTKEGIGIGSSRADVIQAYGTPTTDMPENQRREFLLYSERGLVFQFHDGKTELMQVVFHTTNNVP